MEKPTQRRESGDRREQLVTAALETFAETGSVDFTLADVARKAAVSPALLVHYFGDKERLLDLARASDPEERLRAFVRAQLNPAEQTAEAARLDTGKPIQETIAVDVLSGADCIEYFAGLARTIAGEHHDLGPAAFGYTRREPLGVVAGIGAGTSRSRSHAGRAPRRSPAAIP